MGCSSQFPQQFPAPNFSRSVQWEPRSYSGQQTTVIKLCQRTQQNALIVNFAALPTDCQCILVESLTHVYCTEKMANTETTELTANFSRLCKIQPVNFVEEKRHLLPDLYRTHNALCGQPLMFKKVVHIFTTLLEKS